MKRSTATAAPGATRHALAGARSAWREGGYAPRLFGLRLRLLALVLVVLVPWLALVLYTQTEERRVAIAAANADAMHLMRVITSNQSTQIEAARQLLTALARLPQLRSPESSQCSAFLAEMLTAYPLYLNFAVADRNGDFVCSALPAPVPINIADRAYFRPALEQRRFAVGDYQVGRVTRQPSLNYGYPVLDATGNVQGVAIAAQSLRWLTLALDNVELPRDAVLSVTDRHGTVLARIPALEDSLGKTMPEEPILRAVWRTDGSGVVEADDAQGVRRLWAYAAFDPTLHLHAVIGVPKSVALGDIDRRFRRNLAALGLVTAIGLAASWLGSKAFILRQVDALVIATRDVAAGRFGTRAPLLGGRSELGVLARSFNSMAETLEARDRALRAAEERSRAAEVELAVTRAHIEIARQIQKSLLPEDPLSVAGMQLAGRCIPAVAVGGDYFGYFQRDAGSVDAFIGDVSGHGVGAALLMAEARTTFLAERLAAPSAASILTKLNEVLFDDLDRASLFMSASCAMFDGPTHRLRYASAAHPPALLLRAGEGRCTLLDAEGVLLGIRPGATFAETEIALHAGDLLVLYTDGITEAQNDAGEMFGCERLGQCICAHRHEAPEQLIDATLRVLQDFAGHRAPDDDLTIVAMKVLA